MVDVEEFWICHVCKKSISQSELEKHHIECRIAEEYGDATDRLNTIVEKLRKRMAEEQLAARTSTAEQLEETNETVQQTAICEVCKNEMLYGNIKRHIRRMHNSPEHEWLFEKICCSICGISLKLASLRGHMEITHSYVSLESEKIPFRCKVSPCRATFVFFSDYI